MATVKPTPFVQKGDKGPPVHKNAVTAEQALEIARKAVGERWRSKGDMGTFSVTIAVAHPDTREFVEVEALVDTGSTDTLLPTSLLDQLGIERKQAVLVEDANLVTTTSHIGWAIISWEGLELPCPIIFGVEDVYLLGATTLELFKLTVDPVNQELVPTAIRRRPL